MNKYQWQEDILNGMTKGQLRVIAMGRGTGKSMFSAMYMEQMLFTSSYTDWEKEWVWPWNSKTSIFGKKIWGKINSRYSKLTINHDGSRSTQYATEREIFKKELKDGKGW